MSLSIASNLKLPLEAVTQTFAIPGHRAPRLINRFWRAVETADDGCWGWKRYSSHANQYGRLDMEVHGCRVVIYAHRLSYVIHFGEIDPGLYVCHHCDNPPCCRPNHLFLGTQTENMQDAKVKGRAPTPPRLCGIANHNAALSDEQIVLIRLQPGKQRDLAAEHGVSQSTIWRIRHGLTRKGAA